MRHTGLFTYFHQSGIKRFAPTLCTLIIQLPWYLLFWQLVDQLQDLRLIITHHYTTIAPINNLYLISTYTHSIFSRRTYNWPLQSLWVRFQLFQSIRLILSSRKQLSCTRRSTKIFQDAPELILGWRLLCYFELEIPTRRSCWCAVIAGLVFSSIRAGFGRCLFEHSMDSDRSWGSCFAEESDNIESFVLEKRKVT